MSVRAGVLEHLRQTGFIGSPATDDALGLNSVSLLKVVFCIFLSLPSGDSLGRLHPFFPPPVKLFWFSAVLCVCFGLGVEWFGVMLACPFLSGGFGGGRGEGSVVVVGMFRESMWLGVGEGRVLSLMLVFVVVSVCGVLSSFVSMALFDRSRLCVGRPRFNCSFPVTRQA